MSLQVWLRSWFSDPENVLLIALFTLLVLLGLALVSRARALKAQMQAAYEPRPELFSDVERRLLEALENALGEPWRVLVKLPLAELVRLCPGLGKKNRRRALEKLYGRVVDFVVCDRDSLRVAAVVLASPADHDRVSRVREVLEIAGIPLFAGLDFGQFKAPLTQALGLHSEDDPSESDTEDEAEWQLGRLDVAPAAPADDWQLGETSSQPLPAELSTAPEAAERPTCASCGAPMQRRRVAKGAHAGKLFWVCTDYPRCRRLLKIPEA